MQSRKRPIELERRPQEPIHTSKPLILFIDAYDSFSNNIVSLLETTLSASVRTVKIDNPELRNDEALYQELQYYAAVVCGPGPGHPLNEEDVGIITKIWKLGNRQMLPVLGICLGFQSLCAQFGAEVKRLKGPQHGIIRRITHIGESDEGIGSIFEGVEDLHATLYQSLCAEIGHQLLPESHFQEMKWLPAQTCPDLVPLAWACWDGNEDNDSGMKDERILVAVRHSTKPFWALQYHPESVCTNSESEKIVQNWFSQAQEWNHTCRKLKIKSSRYARCTGEPAVRESLLGRFERVSTSWEHESQIEYALSGQFQDFGLDHVYHCQSVPLPNYMSIPEIMHALQDSQQGQILLESSNAHEINGDVRGRYSIIALDVEDGLRFEYRTGSDCVQMYYAFGGNGLEMSNIRLGPFGGIWPFLAQFLEKRLITNGNPDCPFWGGFMGYTTYEMGLEAIDVHSKARENSEKAYHGRPDLSFAWVTRSVVVDHEKGFIYLQGLDKKCHDNCSHLPEWIVDASFKLEISNSFTPEDLDWAASYRSSKATSSPRSSTSHLDATTSPLSPSSPAGTPRSSSESSPERPSLINGAISTRPPNDLDYESKVGRCQGLINNGESYELCLTDQTTVTRPRLDKHWAEPVYPVPKKNLAPYAINPEDYYKMDLSQDKKVPPPPRNNNDAFSLYNALRSVQPAPFASYIRLGAATLISASPERFLKWDANGKCELRPMKGTVRKSASVSTLEQAKALLDVPKEKAENLMIVDLVRHDLHGVCGSGNVSVPRLMVVEEYRSVFQMISIVQGQIPKASPPTDTISPVSPFSMQSRPIPKYTGIDVLSASLPPGSMTGAPKKRSCEILSEIEDKERSLYSGVVGYMDVGGRGDFSVTIRAMFRWDDDVAMEIDEHGRMVAKDQRTETWHIGAGGAVTTLSTPEGEREEMQTKLRGTLGLFQSLG